MRVILPLLVMVAAGSGVGYLIYTGSELADTFAIYSTRGKIAILCSALMGLALVWLFASMVRAPGSRAVKKTCKDAVPAAPRSQPDTTPAPSANMIDEEEAGSALFEAAPESEMDSPAEPDDIAARLEDIRRRHEIADKVRQDGQSKQDFDTLNEAAGMYADLLADALAAGAAELAPVFLSKRGFALFWMSSISSENTDALLEEAIQSLTSAHQDNHLQKRSALLVKTQAWLGDALSEKARRTDDAAAAMASAEYYEQAKASALASDHTQLIGEICHKRGRALLLAGQLTGDQGRFEQSINAFDEAIAARQDAKEANRVAFSRELQAVATLNLAELNGSNPALKELAGRRMLEAAAIYNETGQSNDLDRSRRFLEKLNTE